MSNLKQKPAFKLGCIIVAALLVLGSRVIAPPEGLSPEGWTMLAIVFGAMILFISEAMPLAATCFMIIVTMKYTGVMAWKAIQQSACSSTVFFCMAGFGIG
ncbi:anion permease, partial [Clostridium fessum]|uniref:anion permease n=1 Tax=Clostridium fessum TaxID=2126740 RepID=UPI002A7FF016